MRCAKLRAIEAFTEHESRIRRFLTAYTFRTKVARSRKGGIRSMTHHATNQLNVEGSKAQNPLRGLPNDLQAENFQAD